jgi:ABC-2 type transport system ATP-binding protein
VLVFPNSTRSYLSLLKEAWAIIDTVGDSRSRRSTPEDLVPEGKGALQVVGLSKRYGEVTALSGLSFTVGEGEMLGFVGTNGAGKTTTMRIMLGVLKPDQGEVLWHGKRVDAQVRSRFGYMPEERGLYPKMRVKDQLTYLARLHGLSARDAKVAASTWMERLGIAQRGKDQIEALSLGNQQRVQLAAALVHDPEVLILDEPFSGLDPVGVDALSAVLLERAAAGVPIVFSSHQLELVERLCESVVLIDRGSLVAQGYVRELRSLGNEQLLRVRIRRSAAWSGGGHRLDWASGLQGVEMLEANQVSGASEDDFLLSLKEGADEQKVLDAARAAGQVVHFAFEQRSLSEIFRQVIER